ncbi:MAG: N-acetyltransferase family protein [Candidatus Saccharibacteria bacterium]
MVWFEHMSEKHRKEIIDLFNEYVENSFASFNYEKVDYGFYDEFMNSTRGYPRLAIMGEDGSVAGFAFLKPYHRTPDDRQVAEATCYLKPEYTRRGIGEMLYRMIGKYCRLNGMKTMVAGVSSLNNPCLEFMKKLGFKQFDAYRGAGRKLGRFFDIVWLKKAL